MSTAYTFINIPSYGDYHWKSPVLNFASLPSSGNNKGDVRVTLDSYNIYVWNGTTWVDSSGGAFPSFGVIQTDFGTFPTASAPTDTVDFTSSNNSVTITGNSATKTVNFQVANPPVVIETSTYNIASTDYYVVGNASGIITFNLPAATGSKRILVIKNVNTNFNSAIVVTPNGTDTVGGETSQTLHVAEGFTLEDYTSGAWLVY